MNAEKMIYEYLSDDDVAHVRFLCIPLCDPAGEQYHERRECEITYTDGSVGHMVRMDGQWLFAVQHVVSLAE